jgi:nitroreductase
MIDPKIPETLRRINYGKRYRAIRLRKSVRSYIQKEVSPEDLNTILLAGCAAPVGMGAYDTLHMTVVTNKNLLDEIAAVAAEMFGRPGLNPFYGSTNVVIISSKPNPTIPGIEYANAGCVIENMMLAATSLGLGSVFLMGVIASQKTRPD